MNHQINVYALPADVAPEDLAGGTVVVIDVLRASTSIVHALAAGAAEVIPCLEVDDARRVAADLPRESVVLGGERLGIRIDGFDLGNSPTEYTPESVGGRTVAFTTTNGTKAMQKCGAADRVLIGAFVNAAAVYRQLMGPSLALRVGMPRQGAIHLLCAGTRGEPGPDDLLLAGLLVDRLQRATGDGYALNAQAVSARQSWVDSFAVPYATEAERLPPELLADRLRETPAGRNVISIDRDADITTVAQLDSFDLLPQLDPTTFRIRAE